jgi:hypothetical protein
LPRQPELEAPPVEPWPVFHQKFASTWEQGQHCLFVGPAGSGKTVAARTLAWDRRFVVVLGTKMRDSEMDAYIKEGYVRTEIWPPERKALKPRDDGSIRVVLWPKIKNRNDLRRFRGVFANCLDSVLVDGGWTVVADEGLWLSDRNGLGLGDHLAAIAYSGRSSGVTLMMVVQRPRGVPVNCWSNASHAFLWHVGNTDDARELASLGVTDRKAVVQAVSGLQDHDFLYLPCRAGRGWAISKVDIARG